jgi:hypothetical protein
MKPNLLAAASLAVLSALTAVPATAGPGDALRQLEEALRREGRTSEADEISRSRSGGETSAPRPDDSSRRDDWRDRDSRDRDSRDRDSRDRPAPPVPDGRDWRDSSGRDRDWRDRDPREVDGSDAARREAERREAERRAEAAREESRRAQERAEWERRARRDWSDRRDDSYWHDRRDWRDPRWGDNSWQSYYGTRGWRRDWYDQRWSGNWGGQWGYNYDAWRFPGFGWNRGWTPGWNDWRREPPGSRRGFYQQHNRWVPSPWAWDRALRNARRYDVIVYRSWRDARPDARLDYSNRVIWLADRAEWVFLRGQARRYWFDQDLNAYYTRDDDGALVLIAMAPYDIGLGAALGLY